MQSDTRTVPLPRCRAPRSPNRHLRKETHVRQESEDVGGRGPQALIAKGRGIGKTSSRPGTRNAFAIARAREKPHLQTRILGDLRRI